MAQCRDLENHHHEKLLEISINTLEKMVKGEPDEDLPDDVRAVSAAAGEGPPQTGSPQQVPGGGAVSQGGREEGVASVFQQAGASGTFYKTPLQTCRV